MRRWKIDPCLSANIYASGHLDEVLSRAVAPFWRRFGEQHPEAPCQLWTMRYGRGGEHLKVRLHGPEELEAEMRSLLTQHVEACLGELGDAPDDAERDPHLNLAPIDEEDRTSDLHPDRTLQWTHYGRSHVSLGGEPLLSDDPYVARFTRCLSAACERVLDAFEDLELPVSLGQRQRLLLAGLLEGLNHLELSLTQKRSYLGYHRDWLIRYPLLKSGAGPEKAAKILERISARARKMTPMAEALQDSLDVEAAEDDAGSPWPATLRDLQNYVEQFRNDPDYHLDPFTEGPAFPTLFKAFHGFANQLGLKMFDEAFTHHLLWWATGKETRDEEPQPVDLIPAS